MIPYEIGYARTLKTAGIQLTPGQTAKLFTALTAPGAVGGALYGGMSEENMGGAIGGGVGGGAGLLTGLLGTAVGGAYNSSKRSAPLGLALSLGTAAAGAYGGSRLGSLIQNYGSRDTGE